MPGHDPEGLSELPAYRISYRDVRYPRLELKRGTLLVVMPRSARGEPAEVIRKHRLWVEKRQNAIEAALREASTRTLDTRRSEEEFREIVREQARSSSARLGCEIGKVFFRRMRSKWASCSKQRNLTFNRYLCFLPQRLIEYVVYHEVAHVGNRNHDARFWQVLQKEFTDSNRRERELLAYWFLLQKAIRAQEIHL